MTSTATPASTWTFPAFHRVALGDGLEAVACPLPGRGMVALRVFVDVGPLDGPPGRDGLSAITAKALTEGTRDHTAEDLGRRLEMVGGDLAGGVTWEGVQLGGGIPRARWRELVAVAGEVVAAPAFAADAVQRLVAARLGEITLEREDPSSRAYSELMAALYAPGSRYAAPLGGTRPGVIGLEPGDVQALWSRARAISVVVAGDVDAGEVAETVSGAFPRASAAGGEPPGEGDAPGPPGMKIVVVDRPGAAQSSVVVGQRGLALRDRDAPASALFAQALGGGGMLTTRVNRKLREEKGYTYGAYAAFEERSQRGPVLCRAIVDGPATVDAVNDFHREIQRLLDEGLEPGELATVRAFLHGSGPIRWQTPAAIADAVTHLVAHGLPDDHYDRLREGLLAADEARVIAAGRAELDPGRLVTVVAGDAAAHRAGLEGLGIGEVTVVPADA